MGMYVACMWHVCGMYVAWVGGDEAVPTSRRDDPTSGSKRLASSRCTGHHADRLCDP
jgi:hypothetical protein